ncbi:MAG: tetratricopeptide repeat protein [Burkholderiaceae bacterium]|nr:tetratricopeptide repeat protein [Burkholderiaceae bacterium]
MPAYLRLLGRPQIEHDGVRSMLPAERRCQLLALLALRRGWVARAELAALFWPGQQRPLAQANLRKALHFARLLPWAAALEAHGSAVRFVVATDLHDVEQALREGRTEAALELCRGELLDGLDELANAAWTDWLDAERAQHARRVHELTRARLAQLRSEPHAAMTFARRLLQSDPLDEDAVVALLTAQRDLGAYDEQRETYRAFALRLEEELGVEPSQRVSGPLRAVAAPAADGFIGRTRELGELAALLARDECRLLSVVGPGGVGKSSLLKQALKALGSRFADGALWIALDDLTDAAQATSRIAAELKLAPAAQPDLLAFVGAQLRPRHLLLVLDNAEHLAGLPRLVERLLAAAPQLKICTTSRVRLGLSGERLLALQGLSLPPAQAATNELLASDAARLFVAGAATAQPDFDARAQAPAIGALVHAVGGLPLAILLAAHWVRLLPVAEIAAELERSLDVLDSGADGEERPEHRSMLATFERSWQMLATREQQVLATLSVFVGSFSREAAGHVAGAALPLLAALADKSLLQMPPGGRCALHPLIRQFAAGKLDADAHAAAQRRHAEWFHRLLERLGDATDEAHACDTIEAELENCRAAWHWAAARRMSALLAASSTALLRFFELRGRAAEGTLLLLDALAAGAASEMEPAHAAELQSALAQLQYRQYRLDDAAASARAGIKTARASARHAALARCLVVLGACHSRRGQDHQARRFFERALAAARSANARRTVAVALGHLATIDKALGDYDRALERSLEVLAMQRELGDWAGVAARLNMLAHLHQQRGQWQQARAQLDEALAVCDQHGVAFARPHLLFNLANTCYLSGDLDTSQHAGQQALDAARATGDRGVEATALLHLARVAVKRGHHAPARRMLHEAVTLAEAADSAPLQLDALFCYAELVAAAGAAAHAAALLRYLIARPEVDAADRQIAQQSLDALPAGNAAELPIDTPLATLVQQMREATAPGTS